MSALADRIYAQSRVVPIQAPNKVVSVAKSENGDLLVTQASGNQFTVSQNDEMFQAFIVYTMIQDP